MCKRILWIFSAVLLTCVATQSLAQQSGSADDDLKLNLDQFSTDTAQPQTDKDLELNLDQFKPAATDAELRTESEPNDSELNLEQFDKDKQESELNLDKFTKANPTSPTANQNSANQTNGNQIDASATESASRPEFKYTRVFIVGGLMFLVFLIIMSKWRNRKRRSGQANRM